MSDIQLIAFDLDGTLTQHKSPLTPENRAVLEKLSRSYKLLMVGAGQCSRIFRQLGGFPIDVIGNYGMQYGCYDADTGELVMVRNEVLWLHDREEIEDRVTALRKALGLVQYRGESVEFYPSGCVTLPVLGTKAELEEKLAFDPDRKKRRAILGQVAAAFPEYTVFLGGSSSFDMAPKPYNKYNALDRYCRENGIAHDRVVCCGDDYGPGGNDEPIFQSDFSFVKVDDYRKLAQYMAPYL